MNLNNYIKTLKNKSTSEKKELLYLFSLFIFVIGLPLSNALISISGALLILIWIITGDFKSKLKRIKNNKTPLFFIAIFIPYIIGYFFASNQQEASRLISKGIYWLIFGLIIGSSSKITSIQTKQLLTVYSIAVIISAIIAFIRLLFAEQLNLENFRAATLTDHMPFSFQLSFVIWIIIYSLIYGNLSKLKIKYKILLILSNIFLFIILLTLKSFNAYIYFFAVSFAGTLLLAFRAKNKIIKISTITASFAIIIIPIAYIVYCIHLFYDTKEYSFETIEHYTAKGNLYVHDFNNKAKENGNYTYLFLCEKEIKPLWNSVSNLKYDSCFNNYESYKDVLIRYMTSKGLRKDAEGFLKLTNNDIKNIENKNANYIFSDYNLFIYPRIYETIWEVDQYLISKNPNNKSLAQRIDLTLLALDIIKSHPIFGVGLGNLVPEYEKALEKSESKLDKQYLGSPHNQYLGYAIQFGIIGLIFIIFCILYPYFKQKKYKNFLCTIFMIGILFANFGDCNFETFVGINFFGFFYALFLWTFPDEFFNNVNKKNNL